MTAQWQATQCTNQILSIKLWNSPNSWPLSGLQRFRNEKDPKSKTTIITTTPQIKTNLSPHHKNNHPPFIKGPRWNISTNGRGEQSHSSINKKSYRRKYASYSEIVWDRFHQHILALSSRRMKKILGTGHPKKVKQPMGEGLGNSNTIIYIQHLESTKQWKTSKKQHAGKQRKKIINL